MNVQSGLQRLTLRISDRQRTSKGVQKDSAAGGFGLPSDRVNLQQVGRHAVMAAAMLLVCAALKAQSSGAAVSAQTGHEAALYIEGTQVKPRRSHHVDTFPEVRMADRPFAYPGGGFRDAGSGNASGRFRNIRLPSH